MNNTTTTARPHIVWLDALRFVAILMVIACHCTDPFNASPESRANPDFNFWGSAYGSMLSASVCDDDGFLVASGEAGGFGLL